MNVDSTKIRDQYSVYLEKVATDFEDLFLGKREGHLAEYMYEGVEDSFKEVTKENEHYYVIRSDIDNISKNSKDLYGVLGDDINFIELGPGSESSVKEKTLPLLKEFKSISSYHAVDYHIKFSLSASNLVKLFIPNVQNVFSYKSDFTKDFPVQKINGRVCVLLWGSTFSNFLDSEINQILQNINKHLKVGDFFIASMDCSSDLDLIKKAYSAKKISRTIIINIFKFFKNKFNLHCFDDSKFEFEYKWNKEKNEVNLCLKAKEAQRFSFYGRIIDIPKGKKYSLVRSRKFSQGWVDLMLRNNGFKCAKTFSNKENVAVNIYVAQKV
jgi:uncharacterized SAM-dependent methyltransferase